MSRRALETSLVALLPLPLVVLLVLPVVGLVASSSLADLGGGFRHPSFFPALALSARTTLSSTVLVILAGTPLAWWLASTPSRLGRAAEVVVSLPIVLPPAVVGIGLLRALGRSGSLGPVLDGIGVHLPFTTAAVVLAQITVSAPFYVLAAAAAFRAVDPDLVLVARTLGQTPAGAFLRVALRMALPGLVSGAGIAWARALGEFGATLLFAGNRLGVTQTLPLAIYSTLESDVRGAVAIALVLAAVSSLPLFVLRWLPAGPQRRAS